MPCHSLAKGISMRSPSLGGHSTGRYYPDDDRAVRHAARQACERLAGLTVVNHATQLAITLAPEALEAAAAPGMPAGSFVSSRIFLGCSQTRFMSA
jgi:hypothetical protein